MIRREVTFPSGSEQLAGELLLPGDRGPYPAVLLLGGTLSDTRDGDLAVALRGEAPKHGLLRITAERLAAAGIASLRWDKRGVGASSGGDRDEHSDVWTDVDDAEAALHTLAGVAEVDKTHIFVLGESAGGYFLCFLAQRTNLVAGYILQAALYGTLPELMEFNFDRVAAYCARGAAEQAWVQQVAPGAYIWSQHWRAMVAAAERGALHYTAGEGEKMVRRNLRRLQQELALPPAEQFRHIRQPTLVIQGDCDMNVPPGDCQLIAQALHAAGNQQVTLVVVPQADHSMQLAPADAELRLRQRISLESFHNPYVEHFFVELVQWIKQMSA